MLGGDIRIKWSTGEQCADLVLDGEIDLSSDAGLETAVVISLFSDRRAGDEELPAGETRLKGWWGDSVSEIENDQIGSKLWLLYREKHLSEVAKRAKEYVEDALLWLTETRVASKVEVETELLEGGMLGIRARILRPGTNTATEFRYNYNWKAQEAERHGV